MPTQGFTREREKERQTDRDRDRFDSSGFTAVGPLTSASAVLHRGEQIDNLRSLGPQRKTNEYIL